MLEMLFFAIKNRFALRVQFLKEERNIILLRHIFLCGNHVEREQI